MKEKTALSINKLNYSGFWMRMGAALLDSIIIAIPNAILFYVSLHLSVRFNTIIPFVIFEFIMASFIVLMDVKFGGSPGQLLLKMRVINKNGKNISILQAIIRYYIYGLILIIFTLNRLHTALNNYQSYDQIKHYFVHNSSIKIILTIINALFVVWILVSKSNQSIYDMIAGSYVVDLEKRETVQNKPMEDS